MKLKLLTLLLALSVAPLGVPAADSLERGFAQPPDSTKPWCYWYWITDNISREGITKDLEAMKRVGISEAFIGNIYLDEVKHGTVKALTEEWWGMVEHAIREGGRLGVDIGMFNCPGLEPVGRAVDQARAGHALRGQHRAARQGAGAVCGEAAAAPGAVSGHRRAGLPRAAERQLTR